MRWMLLFIFPLLAEAADKSPKEVVALWRALPKLARDTPDAAYRTLHTWLPDRGLRGLYAKAQFALNLAQLQKLSGQKIFGSGPHQNGKLNLKSANDFGHYNPAFIKWLAANGIPGQKNPKPPAGHYSRLALAAGRTNLLGLCSHVIFGTVSRPS